MNIHERNIHQLAENLGMTVRRLQAELTVAEYFSWMRYYVHKSEEASQPQTDPRNILTMDDPDSIARALGAK